MGYQDDILAWSESVLAGGAHFYNQVTGFVNQVMYKDSVLDPIGFEGESQRLGRIVSRTLLGEDLYRGPEGKPS